MNKTEHLPFRTFVPLLVANLEDADAGVREMAKMAVVELFRYAFILPYTFFSTKDYSANTAAAMLQNMPRST